MSLYQTEKDTPAYKLFNSLFDVSLPAAFVRTNADQRMFGFVSTNDPVHDNQNAHMHVQVMRTIPTLAELLDDGCDVNILRPEKQVPLMVQLIRDHIDSLLTIFTSSQNQLYVQEHYDTPEFRADIECLERFAEWLLKRPRETLPVERRANDVASVLRRFAVIGKSQTVGQVTEVPAAHAADSFRATLARAGDKRINKWD